MILVTGGTGFVGSHVVRALRGGGLSLRLVARRPERHDRLRGPDCEVVQGDMTDAESLVRAAAGCEAVVHLVALPPFSDPKAIEKVMVNGTRDLVAAAKEAAVRRFVLMSALGASEETVDVAPYYGAKWAMEHEVMHSGLEHVIFRPSFIFGRDGGILGTFRKLAKLMPVTPIIGTGTQVIQPLWIDDVGAYFAAAVDKEEAAGRLFEIGGPDRVSWNGFWERLKRTLGVRRPSFHVPMALARANAVITERLPGEIPLTRDLLKMLEAGDNVVSNDDAVETFALPLVPLDEQLRRAA